MNKLNTSLPGLLLIVITSLPAVTTAQPPTQKPAAQSGQGMNPDHRQDMQTIHALFDAHKKITRQVTITDDGVITLTESSDSTVQAMISAHAQAMKQRLEKGQPIRLWDPLFAALFENAAKISIEIVPTAHGVRVTETSKDPYVASLIKAHAAGVSEFVRDGAAVMHKPHPLPDRK